jgi:hypothetical protein
MQSLFGELFNFLLDYIFLEAYLINGWLQGVDKDKRKLILVGASALCWALWLFRNDRDFDKSSSVSYMQVIFRATY